MKIVPVTVCGEITKPLRNIRCTIDERSATFELIPQTLGESESTTIFDVHDPKIREVLEKAIPVLEGSKLLRIAFEGILGVAVDADIDVDLFGGVHNGWDTAPKLQRTGSYYPFLEIHDSPWKSMLPEWRRRDDPRVNHYRMISAGCRYDVLGEITSADWRPNPPAT